ncbi:leptin [Anomaloglossus baeobatrachus]|uniref:leptin n=1 Tax=Anomaloglossus baeobatrachus TaxID=238106 RepID=UPI003F4F6EC2
MQYILLSLFWIVWMRIPQGHGRPLRTDRLKADAKLLSKILITRIQEHPIQLNHPSSLKSNGLDFIPDEEILVSLEKMDETLETFQNILSSIPMEHVEQMLSDIENLRSLLQILNLIMGCAAREPQQTNLEYLKEQHENASYTMEKVTLDRLEKTLHSIVRHVDIITSC